MPQSTGEFAAVTDKFLTFRLGDELYGLEILRVQEIVGLLPVTRVPRLPGFVAGVVNLRGRVVPVVDIRSAFGMSPSDMGERSCIIVVRIERTGERDAVIGAIVDEVADVVALAKDDIEGTPSFGTQVDTSFLRGVGRLDERVVLLLDIDRVLDSRELAEIERAALAPVQQSS